MKNGIVVILSLDVDVVRVRVVAVLFDANLLAVNVTLSVELDVKFASALYTRMMLMFRTDVVLAKIPLGLLVLPRSGTFLLVLDVAFELSLT